MPVRTIDKRRDSAGIVVANLRRMLPPSQLIRWTLSRSERRLTCVERSIPSGCECSVLYDGLPVAVRVLPKGEDVDSWAAQIRSAWESVGWLSVGPGQSNAPHDRS